MSFTPVIQSSQSIVKSLLKFSKEKKIDLQFLDFELLSHETLIKKEKYLDYKMQDMQNLTKDDLLNPTTLIMQKYNIKIFPIKNTHYDIQLSLATNKLKTRAIVTILKGSVFKKGLDIKNVKDLIWSKKLRAGLLINIFEPKLDLQIAKLLKIIPVNKPLAKDLKFTVALGVHPIPTVDATIKKLYEKRHQDSDSIINSIDRGELILQYFKEKNGVNGRACDGKIIQIQDPKTINVVPVIDETVRAKESEDFIEYFANNDGYVSHEGANLSILKSLELEGANFKSSANIDGGDSSKDISLHIAHKKSHSEDAVGSGVKINVKELSIDGSVGANVNISAQELNIDAQTHKNSKIEVQNSANVKLHRGDMVANDAEIDILESGKITAHKSIHIKQMLGGEAIAPIIKVDSLLSNATIIASDYIEIKSIEGSNNKLIINPDAIDSYHKNLEAFKQQLKSTTAELKVKKEDLNERSKEHYSQVDRIKTFQKRVLAKQKAGQTPMKQDVIRVKIFKRDTQKLKEEESQLAIYNIKIEEITLKIDKMQNQDLHAKIISHSKYDGHSKVIFVNIKTKKEILYMPEGKIETISLMLNDEGERVIKLD